MPNAPDRPLSLEALLGALDEAGADRTALPRLLRASGRSIDALYAELDSAGPELLRRSSPAVCVELVLAAPLAHLATASRFVEPLGERVLPELALRAKAWSASPYRDAREAILLSLCFQAARPNAPFPAEHDAMLTEALRAVGLEAESRPTLERLRALLRGIPEARREALIFGEQALEPSGRGHLLWAFAGVCPRPRVIQGCIDEALTWRRSEFERAPARRELIEECFTLFGTKASPLLAIALLGPARRAAQRPLLARALAHAPTPEAAPVLAAMLSEPTLQATALEALRSLGPDVVEKALSSEPVALQRRVRKALVPAPPPPLAPARHPLAAAACLTPPSGAQLLAAWTRELTAATIDASWAKLDLEHGDAPEIRKRARALVRKDPRHLLAFAARFREALARGEGQLDGLDLDFFWEECAQTSTAFLYLAAELLTACSARGPVPIKQALQRAGELIGLQLGPAIAASVPPAPSPARRHYLTWLAEHAPGHGLAALSEAADDEAAPHRELVARGMVRAGPSAVPMAILLLKRGAGAREVGAEVLRALPSEASIAPLQAALRSERDAHLRTLLESALNACRLSTQPKLKLDVAELDASLAARADPAAAALSRGLPAPRWRDGDRLSTGAMRWLLAALQAEAVTPPDAELRAVRARLDEKSCAALSKAILTSFPPGAEPPWALTQVAVLGSDAMLNELGASLADRVAAQGANHAAFGTESLKRSGRLEAVRWLDHWSRHGSARLRRESREALVDLAQQRGREIDQLVDDAFTLSRPADLERDVAHLRERLETALVIGRSWSPERFAELFVDAQVGREAAAGLVFASRDGTTFALDARGRRVSLDASKLGPLRTEVGLMHPVDHEGKQIERWAKQLKQRRLAPPFAQLERAAFRDPVSTIAALLPRAVMPPRALLQGLEQLGYRRGEPAEAGLVFDAHREVGAFRIVIDHQGLLVADGRNPLGPTVQVQSIRVRAEEGEPIPLRLHSEAARDLGRLIGDAPAEPLAQAAGHR